MLAGLLIDHGGAAGGNHQHIAAAADADGFVVQVHCQDGIGAELPVLLRHHLALGILTEARYPHSGQPVAGCLWRAGRAQCLRCRNGMAATPGNLHYD